MSGIDYSKWDNIQLSSDDDEDCHPNIEKYTWRRLRQRQRDDQEVKRKEQEAQLKAQVKQKEKAVKEQKSKIVELKREGKDAEADRIAMQVASTEKTIAEKQRELRRLDKQRKMNAEDMCYTAEERTIVNPNPNLENKFPGREKSGKSEDEEAKDFSNFMDKNTAIMQKYSELDSLASSEKFILDNPMLLSQNATGWLLLQALEAEMGGNSKRMRHIVRQNQYLQYGLDLAAMTKESPIASIKKFFLSMQSGQKRHMFERDCDEFAAKIANRAVQKKKEQAEKSTEETEEMVELTKEERMGPGGLDPIEVLETLPAEMKKCFMEQDIPGLHKCLEAMSVEEAQMHMDRCVKSGLWVPEGGAEATSETPPKPPKTD